VLLEPQCLFQMPCKKGLWHDQSMPHKPAAAACCITQGGNHLNRSWTNKHTSTLDDLLRPLLRQRRRWRSLAPGWTAPNCWAPAVI
jgi:hypothetical protein